MRATVCFTSDFGLDDAWVGVCHAVILRSCPQALVVDLAHGIPPFDVRKGAATATAGVVQLPEAIHLVVVDPGVGGSRRDLCITTRSGARLVGPDNGVLMVAAWRTGGVVEAVCLDAGKVGFRGPLPTFLARDVLAPAAAAIACGVAPSALGETVEPDSLSPAPFQRCRFDGRVAELEVVESDHFGSVRFNLPGEDLDLFRGGTRRARLSAGGKVIDAVFGTTFCDVALGDPVLLVDSSGWLTLAVNRGDAARSFALVDGAEVTLALLD